MTRFAAPTSSDGTRLSLVEHSLGVRGSAVQICPSRPITSTVPSATEGRVSKNRYCECVFICEITSGLPVTRAEFAGTPRRRPKQDGACDERRAHKVRSVPVRRLRALRGRYFRRTAPLIACEPKWPLAGIPNTNVMFENPTWVPPVTQTVSGDV